MGNLLWVRYVFAQRLKSTYREFKGKVGVCPQILNVTVTRPLIVPLGHIW